jgi:uncharacterized protein YegP (UPF0339 family)
MYFRIYRDAAGLWRWTLKAANHEPLASGESYYNLTDCRYAVNLVKGSSAAPVYEQ